MIFFVLVKSVKRLLFWTDWYAMCQNSRACLLGSSQGNGIRIKSLSADQQLKLRNHVMTMTWFGRPAVAARASAGIWVGLVFCAHWRRRGTEFREPDAYAPHGHWGGGGQEVGMKTRPLCWQLFQAMDSGRCQASNGDGVRQLFPFLVMKLARRG